MKTKIILLLIVSSILFSCNEDDKIDEIFANLTTVTIKTTNTNNNILSGIKVYAYLENNWLTNGDDITKADRTFTTNNKGLAVFSINYIPNTFVNSTQEKVYFSAHYILNNSDKTKVATLIFNKGNKKNITLVLD